MSKPLCIFHANCPDGYTAAWIVHHHYKTRGIDVELFPGVYGEDTPRVLGRNVIIADFSYPVEMMHEIADKATSLLVLDHHQTAFDNCLGLDQRENVVVELDINRSGARLTWDYYHEDEPVLDIVAHVEDRDLWRFKLPGTAAYFAALTSHPYTLEAWDEMANTALDDVLVEGQAIERYRRQLVDLHLLLAASGVLTFGDCCYELHYVNAPYAIASDVAGELAKQSVDALGGYYFDDLANGKRSWGLRSTPDGPDVAWIAEQLGGGGHKHAAGFRTEIGWLP